MKGAIMRQDVIWTIVGILVIVALLVWLIPRLSLGAS